MPVFERRLELPVSAEALFEWHARPGAFERLMPPWEHLRVLARAGGIADGATLEMAIGPGPLALRWLARHEGYEPGRQFRDVQVSGPFARWVHTHRFEPRGPAASTLVDHVDYALPGGPLGALVGGPFAAQMLDRMFRFRLRRTRDDLARHAAFADRGPLRVAITGASGLIGAQLAAFLTTGGHTVAPFVRRAARPGEEAISWDPAAGTVDEAALAAFAPDVVIHLAGENVAGGRWTAERKRAIRESRARGTAALAGAIARMARPPRALLSASAIGFYGDRGDAPLDEAAGPGEGFLAEVTRAWEAAAAPASEAGVRVAFLRLGVVLSPQGGALAKLRTPFSLGLGGPIGAGDQVMSWIDLDDAIGAIHFLAMRDDLAGPFNLTAPAPETNAAFARTLGQVLGRPAALPLPAPVIRAAFGEMGEAALLEGARVLPGRLEAAGFRFLHPTLEGALRVELGREGADGPGERPL